MVQRQTAFVNLPNDALRQIMIRVAKPPNGNTDLVRMFSTCKNFYKFTEDETVLKTVRFDNFPLSRRSEPFLMDEMTERLAPEFDYLSESSIYEPYQHVGGLITKCAIAGHPDAQIILAKIIMVSAAQLLTAREDGASSEPPVEDEALSFQARGYTSTKHAKAESFFANFTPEKTGNFRHFDFVRMFLSQASHTELEDMKHCLKDFIKYFLPPGVEAHHQQFLYLLEELCESNTLLIQSTEAIVLVGMCNNICKQGYIMLRALDLDQQLLDALMVLMLTTSDMLGTDPEEIVDHFMLIMSVVEQGLREVGNGVIDFEQHLEIFEVALAVDRTIGRFRMLRKLIETVRAKMISAFDAMFAS